jgi:hypothetical protein
MEIALLVFGVAALAIILRLVAGSMDRTRIAAYVRDRGGRVLDCRWTPFGRGWFGEKSDRIYTVRYVDADGAEHRATCKTSLFTGVYWTEDFIIRDARD